MDHRSPPGPSSPTPPASADAGPPAGPEVLAARYRALTENFPNGMVALYDHDLRYILVEGEGLSRIGLAPADLIGRRLRDVFPPDIYRRDEPALRAALEGQSTDTIVPFGPQWFRVLTIPVRGDDGRVMHGMVMTQDITPLKQTELDLKHAVDRLTLATRAAGLGIWEADLETGAITWSPEQMATYGVGPADVPGTLGDWLSRLHPDDREAAIAASKGTVAGQPIDVSELRIVRPDGEVRHLRTSSAPLQLAADGTPQRLIGVNFDVTELRRGEARLRESEARYRSLFEYTSDAVLLADDAGCIAEANPAGGWLLGRSPAALVGLPVFEPVVGGDDDEASFWHGLRRDGVRAADLELIRPDGSVRHVSVSARAEVQPGLHLLVVRDLTEQRAAEVQRARLEARDRQAQKLEAVGQLTGGVAHDFNNLLHVILAQTEEATFDIAPDHPAREPLLDVRDAAERAQRVVAQLLAFARKQLLRPEWLALDETIGALMDLLEPLFGDHIEIRWRPGPGQPAVHADASAVEQVVMNLCLNARDAMPDGGVIDLRTRVVEVPPAEARELDIEPGRYVELVVRDEGVGMPPEVVPRVFDPFFTTKADGTGMGLATAYGIVRQHRGAIWVESAPGRGAAFTVLWPGADPAPSDAEAPAEVTPSPARGGAVILLAEDNPLVAKVTTRHLERAGHTVIAVADGGAAVAAAAARAAELDLALLDVLMPVMTGPTAYIHIARHRPDLPVVFMSGYSDLSEGARRLVSERPLLSKPFDRRALLDAVRAALGDIEA